MRNVVVFTAALLLTLPMLGCARALLKATAGSGDDLARAGARGARGAASHADDAGSSMGRKAADTGLQAGQAGYDAYQDNKDERR